MKKNNLKFLIVALCAILGGTSYYHKDVIEYLENMFLEKQVEREKILYSYDKDDIPEYNGDYFVYINEGKPDFTESELKREYFEEYSDLDDLNRCGKAFALIGKESMPKEKREGIGSIKPSGWKTVKYDFIDGKYLYNRCHLIGYQLSGENANEKNLITCTRQMNSKTMLDFENKVANYVKKTNNHVLYRVTPIFKGENLLATGVIMEAYSVEDNGKGVSFNVFVYNVQDKIAIDYKTGESVLMSE